MEPVIIYEDEDVLVLNKPSGLVVHSDGKTKEKTLVDWLLDKFPALGGVGEPFTVSTGEVIEKPGIVHRLDRETSGLILVAKTQDSFLNLKSQFQDRKIEKTYHAFVYGKLKDLEGKIDRPIGRSKNDFRKWTAQRGQKGKIREALTYYKVLTEGDNFSFIEACPKTGRTHQIRVHFKAINHPVVCDSLYAPKEKPVLGFNRLALHSYSISFNNLNGEKMEFKAPYPEDFKNAVSALNIFA